MTNTSKTLQAMAAHDRAPANPDDRVWATPQYHPGFLDLLKLQFMVSALRRGTKGSLLNGHYLSRDEMERLTGLPL